MAVGFVSQYRAQAAVVNTAFMVRKIT